MSSDLSASAAISELLVRYCDGCDRRDWTVFDKVFTEDAVGVYRDVRLTSRAAIVSYLQGMLGGVGVTQHMLSNISISVRGEEADCECYLRAWHQGAGRWSRSFYEVFAVYHDEARLTGEGWRLARREIEVRASLGTRELLGSGTLRPSP